MLLPAKTSSNDLRPMLQMRCRCVIALHKHPGVAGVMEAAAELLRMVPGVEVVDLHQPAVGLHERQSRARCPTYKRELQLAELEARARRGRRCAGCGLPC